MYEQHYRVMYLTTEGWKTLRDEGGQPLEVYNRPTADALASTCKLGQDVLDTMTVKVEKTQVYDYVTRQPMVHTTYTGVR